MSHWNSVCLSVRQILSLLIVLCLLQIRKIYFFFSSVIRPFDHKWNWIVHFNSLRTLLPESARVHLKKRNFSLRFSVRTIFFGVKKNVEMLGGFQKYTIALLEFSRGRSGVIESEITEWLLCQSQTAWPCLCSSSRNEEGTRRRKLSSPSGVARPHGIHLGLQCM